jgi:hypothetical protein
MGARLNWLAVEHGHKAELLAQLGLVECGAADDERSAPLVCAEFPGGWVVLVAQDMGLDLDKALPLASEEGLALGCEIEERVMFSRLRAFRDGRPAWSVTHDPDVDPDGVVTRGEPPLALQTITAALAAEWGEDAGVDYMFDAPVRLGRRLCGYSHDDAPPVTWTLLEQRRRGRAPVAAPAPAARTPPNARPQLSAAFRSELLPRLEASGWALEADRSHLQGGDWYVTRIHEGRRQQQHFMWRDDGLHPVFETGFLVLEGADWSDPILLSGAIRAVREGGRPAGTPLWRWIVDQYRRRPEETAADPLDKLIARVKDDLASVEALLSRGEQDGRIFIDHGSAELLKPTAD